MQNNRTFSQCSFLFYLYICVCGFVFVFDEMKGQQRDLLSREPIKPIEFAQEQLQVLEVNCQLLYLVVL